MSGGGAQESFAPLSRFLTCPGLVPRLGVGESLTYKIMKVLKTVNQNTTVRNVFYLVICV